MLEVILDIETTGLSTKEKHKIVEIGCVELNNLIPTNKIFNEYINPKRTVSEEAYKVHGYSTDFLSKTTEGFKTDLKLFLAKEFRGTLSKSDIANIVGN